MLFLQKKKREEVKCYDPFQKRKREFFTNPKSIKLNMFCLKSENKSGYIHGFTENYVKVKIPWNPYLCNKLVKS